MRRLIVILTFTMSQTAYAASAERALTGSEIETLLPTIEATGSNSFQTFDADGHTDYWSGGNKSAGQWRVEDDQYCSVWPPADNWICYDVIIDEDASRLFWVEASGAREKNRYKPRRK